MKKENVAIFEMLMCALLWSTAGIFIKLIPWNPFVIACLRSLIAALTTCAYMRTKHIKLYLNKRTFLAGVLTGLTYTCFVCSNKLTIAANAIALEFTSPVFIVIFTAIILKQKIAKKDISVVLFTLLGIAMFFLDKLEPGYLVGNIISVLSGVFMAGMYVSVGELRVDQRFSATLIGQLFTVLIGLPFLISSPPSFTLSSTLSILALGIFQQGIAFLLYIKSSKYCPPLACCLLGALEPLLNPVWVFIFDGERPGIFALIGGIIVISSITIWCVNGVKDINKQLQAI